MQVQADLSPTIENNHRLEVKRYFTSPGESVFDAVEWERRDAVICNEKSVPIFEHRGVEFPKFWTQLATNITVEKYFRGQLGTPERETSLRQVIHRVAHTIKTWGVAQGYFDTDGASIFYDELCHVLLHQKAAFNSPVWFNLGIDLLEPQVSACFIQSVQDSMESIMDLAKSEVMLFKGGSGTGTNLSSLRSSKEHLRGGGLASGPVSFMKGYDSFAGVTKSGGRTRRAAKMVILNGDHPDIVTFIKCKAEEERKAQALIDAGWDGGWNKPGGAYDSVQYQNANNSVRVTDEFMTAVEYGGSWQTKYVTDGRPCDTYKARDIMRMIAEATHVCGDPGLQYDTTINNWHTCPEHGRINASNPCCFIGETLVDTSAGMLTFEVLEGMSLRGEVLPYAYSFDCVSCLPVVRPILKVWVAGCTKDLVSVETRCGIKVLCTPEHRFLLQDSSYCEAQHLLPGTRLRQISRSEDEGCPNDQVLSVQKVVLEEPIKVYDLEVDGTHNLAVTCEKAANRHTLVVSNSEYMHLDDSACNLSSINLRKFERAPNGHGWFDAKAFAHVVRLMIIAQDILVAPAGYPTESIARGARAFRQLGLGFANLGGLLMSRGLAYDSDTGRRVAAGIADVMQSVAYETSAELAQALAPFDGFDKSRDSMLKVIGKHVNAHRVVPRSPSSLFSCDDLVGVYVDYDEKVVCDLLNTADAAWKKGRNLGELHGYRNSQVTVLAPTGTIAFMMDCDTTGIEPEIALRKTKSMAGGGSMLLVNNVVPSALANLGYDESEIAAVVEFVKEHGRVEGCPVVRAEHLSVFDCSFKSHGGTRVIAPLGHLLMMSAVQPFISGAISKTVNVSNDTTVEQIEKLYIEAWRLGIKALAVYRDGCKRTQPLTTKKADAIPVTVAAAPKRHRLSDERQSLCHKFCIGGHEGYIHVGLYADGTLGELFVRMAKEGSTISGMMDAFATAISIGLQYGVPVGTFIEKFKHLRFEPSGFTNHPDIRMAQSILDYIFRWLEIKFIAKVGETPALPASATATLAIAPSPSSGYFVNQTDAPVCSNCGNMTVRNGTCYKCLTCGSSNGCS